jgi:tetratricopeptide (TPR) repeat protein
VFDVFVNYRTRDARFGAAAAHQFLVGRFGSERVFLDHVSMTPGSRYPDEIRAALEQVRVLVVVIGQEWLACAEGTTVRLIDDEDDWVRREIRRALERRIEIIPVLLDGVAPPTDLPSDIAELPVRQAATVRHTSLNADLGRLADRIVDRVPELALPDLFVTPHELPKEPLPSELLRPEYRVVGFVPVGDQRDRWVAWLDEPGPLAVRLLTGPGGRGKSRLATELVEHARTQGLHAGFVREDVEPGVLERVRAVRGGLVLVVDYAEARSAQVAALVTELLARSAEQGPARVVLLARAGGEWQRALERHDDPRIAALVSDVVTETVSRVVPSEFRRELFTSAVAAFADRLGDHGAVPPPADLDDERYDQVLDVHAAALAAVLDRTVRATTGEVLPARADPVRRVLDHEERYWLRSVPAHGLPARPERVRELVAAATLVGAELPSAARAVLAALRSLDGAGRGAVADHLSWLTRLYPGEGALNPLRPDRLGEDLVAIVLAGYPELAGDLAPVVDDRQLFRALTVLSRAARRHRAVVQPAMTDLLATDVAARIGVGMTVATQVDDPALVDVLGALRGDQDLSAVIVANLPDNSLALAAFAVVHTTVLLRAETRRAEVDRGFVAELRHNLALRLSAVGEHDRALVTAGAAVRDYRDLVEGPDDVVELASALTTLAAMHAELGLFSEGASFAAEAVTLLDDLTADLPDLPDQPGDLAAKRSDALITLADLAHEQGELDHAAEAVDRAVAIAMDLWERTGDLDDRARLASALESSGAIRDSRGETGASLVTTGEAVANYRELDAEQPDTYRAALIRALGNLAGAHAESGLWAEGAELGEEAVALARSLVARHGDVHLVRLADTMNNTAALLRRLDEHDRALAYLDQVVPLYRGLADRVPGTHLAALAGALHNLGNCLHEMGRHPDAVEAYDESVDIYRKLSGPQRADTDESLAETLVGLAHAHVALDAEPIALDLVTEAVELLDHALRGERNRTRRKLGQALHLASAIAFDLGLFEPALRDAERAAGLFGHVVTHEPDRDPRAEHAAVLHSWARALDATEDHDRAAAVFADAIAAYRALPGDDEREGLAGVLVNAAVCASARDDQDTALELAAEAVTVHRELVGRDATDGYELTEALNNLADVHCDRAEWTVARAVADEAVTRATALRDGPRSDADSLAVYALITRARAAGPGDTREVGAYLREARRVAGTDGELLDLVDTWVGELGVPRRHVR